MCRPALLALVLAGLAGAAPVAPVAPQGDDLLSTSPEAKLVAPDGAEEDRFGTSVALDGDTAVVGVPNDDQDTLDSHENRGSAHVFVRAGASWSQEAKLIAGDASGGDGFGGAVAVDGDTLVVGAAGDDDGGSGAGAAYVFVRDGATWTEAQKLVAGDAEPNTNFGTSVAIDGDSLVVGTRTAAYVFVRFGPVWLQQAKLTHGDPEPLDFFDEVAISGDTVVAGVPQHDGPGGTNAGAVFVFVRSGTTWSQQAELFGAEAEAHDWVGASVAIDGDTVAAGSISAIAPSPKPGSVYVFVRSGTTWTQQGRLVASDGLPPDAFGISAALDGERLVVGAITDQLGPSSNAGAAYLFLRQGTTWTEQDKLTAPDMAPGDSFGGSVAVDGTRIVAGASGDDVGTESDAGSAYAFAVRDVITFEGLPAGTVATEVFGQGTLGPVGVFALNPAFGLGTNAAVVFDSAAPSGEDPDLGSPNETCDPPGPGQGLGGEAGAPFENCAALGKLLVVAEDLVDADGDGLIDDPDDADLVGSGFRFDFAALGEVSLCGLTIVDVEADRPPPRVLLFGREGLFLSATLPQTGDNGVAVLDVPCVPGVLSMIVQVNGSGAIDGVVFE